MEVIPTKPDNQNYQQRTKLEGKDYLLDFFYNARDCHWYLSILDQDENPIAYSIKVVANWGLLRYVPGSKKPPGEIVALDLASLDEVSPQPARDPSIGELGTRVILVYFSAEELAA